MKAWLAANAYLGRPSPLLLGALRPPPPPPPQPPWRPRRAGPQRLQPRLDRCQRPQHHRRAHMPHMPDPEEVRSVLRRSMPSPIPSVSPAHLLEPLPQPRPCAAPMRTAVTAWPRSRVRDIQPQGLGAPGLERRPDRPRQQRVPRARPLEPLLEDHVERVAQPEQVMRRRGPVEKLPKVLRGHPRPPVPVGRDAVAPPAPGRPGVEEDEPHPRRRHQPLLAGRHHDVDAPCVHLEPVAAQARRCSPPSAAPDAPPRPARPAAPARRSSRRTPCRHARRAPP